MTHRTLTALRNDRVDIPDVRLTLATPEKTEVRELGIEPVVIGSDPSCDLVVDDPLVSGTHCRVSLGDRGVVVRDLGSKNGIRCGEISIVEAIVPPGTELVLGSSRLTIQVAGKRTVKLSRRLQFGDAVGTSVVMRMVFDRLERAAATTEAILLLGESGTGKHVLAASVHAQSGQRTGPFVEVGCSAIAPQQLEAELFARLTSAHGGTLFIDEIGELPIELQAKLLRVLDADDHGVRVIAATHHELRARLEGGTFRRDLYYRLAVVEVRVAPLRERLDDIPILVERFLASLRPPRSWDDLPPNCLEMLMAHDWPGNARELRNVVARLVLFRGDALDELRVEHSETSVLAALAKLPLREARDVVVEQFERAYVAVKLAETAGNVSRAAEAMGVSRQFLHRLIERYGIRG